MKLAQRLDVETVGSETTEIPLQVASLDIWDSKYRLKKRDGTVVDREIDDTYRRVAGAIADAETTDESRARWRERFLWALRKGAIPAGRIVSNAGAQAHKPATSTINCTVSGAIHDSMGDILEKVYEAGLTLKAGCGIGYEFSTLRPRGAYVTGAGAYTSGPLSFMDIYDRMCFTVSSAGGRRGAQMATFHVGHPDVLDFIRAKREDGRLRQFNLSLLITPRVHGGGSQRCAVAARVSSRTVGGRARWCRSRRSRFRRVARLADHRRLRHERRRAGRVSCVSVHAGAADLGRDHVVDV